MKKKVSKTDSSASKDAVVLGSLYMLSFIVLQMMNFIDQSIKNPVIDVAELQTKGFAQFAAFLTTYFITLMYIKSRST